MDWFGDVPDEVQVAGVRFWLAQEAVEQQAEPGTYMLERDGERPACDWAATSLFLLARFQLDQLIEILRDEFAIDAAAFAGTEVARRVDAAVPSPTDPESQHYQDIGIEMIGEAVDLWRALKAGEGRTVGHGFAVDGSITFTSGPDLPELPTIGVHASNGGELNASPMRVLRAASDCTQTAAFFASRKDEERPPTAGTEHIPESETDTEPWLTKLQSAATQHFSVWSFGSEESLVQWATDLLDKAGLMPVDTELDRARSTARLMSLWALHLELAGHSGVGTPGDWRYDAVSWLDDGISSKQLALLNEADDLGIPDDDEEWEIPSSERCTIVVEHYHRDVVTALMEELGDSETFASLWATRYDDTIYPLPAEVLNDIVNDSSVMEGDPQNKLPAFSWVQGGMWL